MSPLDLWPVALGVALIVGVGLLRRDALTHVAMMSIGYALVLAALLWSSQLGEGARVAVFVAAIGATLTTMGTERSRQDKRPRPEAPVAPDDAARS